MASTPLDDVAADAVAADGVADDSVAEDDVPAGVAGRVTEK
jgi:hypothetical protein